MHDIIKHDKNMTKQLFTLHNNSFEEFTNLQESPCDGVFYVTVAGQKAASIVT